jgi:hypothetical protein
MMMARSTEELLAHADELAKRFENYEPAPGDRAAADPETLLRLAAMKRGEVEAQVASAVTVARAGGLSWAKIGSALGTSGQAANERYAKDVDVLINTSG